MVEEEEVKELDNKDYDVEYNRLLGSFSPNLIKITDYSRIPTPTAVVPQPDCFLRA